MNVNVKYTPGDADPWSQSPSKTIRIATGQNTLDWSIQVIPGSAGTIVFDTTPTRHRVHRRRQQRVAGFTTHRRRQRHHVDDQQHPAERRQLG